MTAKSHWLNHKLNAKVISKDEASAVPGAKVILRDKGVHECSAPSAEFIQLAIHKSFFAYDDIYDMAERRLNLKWVKPLGILLWVLNSVVSPK